MNLNARVIRQILEMNSKVNKCKFESRFFTPNLFYFGKKFCPVPTKPTIPIKKSTHTAIPSTCTMHPHRNPYHPDKGILVQKVKKKMVKSTYKRFDTETNYNF